MAVCWEGRGFWWRRNPNTWGLYPFLSPASRAGWGEALRLPGDLLSSPSTFGVPQTTASQGVCPPAETQNPKGPLGKELGVLQTPPSEPGGCQAPPAPSSRPHPGWQQREPGGAGPHLRGRTGPGSSHGCGLGAGRAGPGPPRGQEPRSRARAAGKAAAWRGEERLAPCILPACQGDVPRTFPHVDRDFWGTSRRVWVFGGSKASCHSPMQSTGGLAAWFYRHPSQSEPLWETQHQLSPAPSRSVIPPTEGWGGQGDAPGAWQHPAHPIGWGVHG